MVALLFTIEYIKWYLITLKLKQILEYIIWYTLKLNQTLESGIQSPQSPTITIQLTTSNQAQKQTVPEPSVPIHTLTKEGNGCVEEEGQMQTDWIISIKEKLCEASNVTRAGEDSWSKLCIYRIPRCLRDAGDDKVYVPQVVSFGPYHHGERQLCNMEPHKWRALQRILERNNQPVELYLNEMKRLEENARHCYDESIMLSSNQFVEMMVLDSSFLFEIIRGHTEDFNQLGYSSDDPIFAWYRAIHTPIFSDMIKLENQIPLFILDRLFGVSNGNPNQKGLIAELVFRVFSPSTSMKVTPGTFDPLPERDGLHLLQVLRRKLLAPQADEISSNSASGEHESVTHTGEHELVHCVTELKAAGIKFKRRESDKFWDIKYKNGVLEIPQLLIEDGTGHLFLNLIAYEQRHMYCTDVITSYVSFMDSLINTPADVSYLHDVGIIENFLGSDAEVAELFNRMCQGVIIHKDNYLSELSQSVNNYRRKSWNSWRATLKQKYFNNPWSIISLFAAAMLLLFTGIQCYVSVYTYFRSTT